MTGRPTKYNKAFAMQAKKLCLLGATDVQLANFFEVAESTIHKWKLDHAEFSESIKEGKDIADAEVAQSLFQRAKGYSHPDVHISNYQGEITVTDITKNYPPDATSAIFWLKNRRKEEWRDKKEVETTVTHNDADSLTESELINRISELQGTRASTGAPKEKASKKVTH